MVKCFDEIYVVAKHKDGERKSFPIDRKLEIDLERGDATITRVRGEIEDHFIWVYLEYEGCEFWTTIWRNRKNYPDTNKQKKYRGE